MSEFQKDIEKIIQKNIERLTGNRQQRKSLHIPHQTHELISELYDHDEHGVTFVNHFGHIEYFNSAFGRMLMQDRSEQSISSIYSIDQLKIDFKLEGEILTAIYPNGNILYFRFSYQLIDFQKAVLLKLTFKDISDIYNSKSALKSLEEITGHYLKHLPVPMFLFDSQGNVKHVPNPDMILFGKTGNKIKDENIFESLPFDYANQVIERTKNITPKTNGHFMYQTEKDRIIKVYDTTVHMVDEGLYLCQVKDVSDLNTMSSTIEYLNSYDSLTGFHNVTYYESTLAGFNDSSHLPMGIYTLTINGLKQVNLRQGYHQCDNLLIEIALTMKALISQHEIPCRITGDTFVIFFPNVSKETMGKFTAGMKKHIDHYKDLYKDYRLTYTEKSILIKDPATKLLSIMKGMIV